MNNTRSFFSRVCHSPIPHRVAVLLFALAWSSLAFCGEIHDAAQRQGKRVKAPSGVTCHVTLGTTEQVCHFGTCTFAGTV